jgi:hypothetical protein
MFSPSMFNGQNTWSNEINDWNKNWIKYERKKNPIGMKRREETPIFL